jgi:asparagine synthase (glutamine-hydrolysing)
MCGICGLVSFQHPDLANFPDLPDHAADPAAGGDGTDHAGRADRSRGAAGKVEAMLGALAHRGPDASALVASGPAVLGATRLAIRGLTDGRQPLVDGPSGVVAVCNGEIDNHRELKAWLAQCGRPVSQATDVAVIPGLYLELGEAFPEVLVGAFAIGLWDPRRRRLMLVRDRAGEKPLFFCTAGTASAAGTTLGTALFATELAALASSVVERTADVEALAHYLRYGCFAVPRTPFAGVQKVGPGERVMLDGGGVRRERYWRWRTAGPAPPQLTPAGPGGSAPQTSRPQAPPTPASSAPPAPSTPPTPPTIAELDRVFRQAVARQTDVEVSCGVFLSGGVDSSLVTAVALSLHPDLPLQAFSLRFPETSYDEGEVAARVARLLGLTTTEVWVRPEDFMSCLPELVRMAGEPLADPAWVPAALLARRAAADVRQVLVGEGGDELFGGYPTHSGVWLGERYEGLPRSLRRLLAGVVARLPPSDKKVTLSFLLKRFVAGEGLEGLQRHLLWTSNIAPETLQRLGFPASAPLPSAMSAPMPAMSASRAQAAPAIPAVAAAVAGATGWNAPPAGTVLDRVQQHDLETSLAEGLLTKADRASMHFALELRAPFLDRDVMELAARLPDEQRVRGLATKVFLKSYASLYLPRWVVHRRKRGLSVPLASWLRGPLRRWAEERLTAGRLGAVGVDEAAALALLGEHLRRERDHARALWTLVVLAEWLDWVAGLGLSPAGAVSAAAADNAAAATPQTTEPTEAPAVVGWPAAAAAAVRCG